MDTSSQVLEFINDAAAHPVIGVVAQLVDRDARIDQSQNMDASILIQVIKADESPIPRCILPEKRGHVIEQG
jgi:hypothetical protein